MIKETKTKESGSGRRGYVVASIQCQARTPHVRSNPARFASAELDGDLTRKVEIRTYNTHHVRSARIVPTFPSLEKDGNNGVNVSQIRGDLPYHSMR